jgi:hypothetical protein
VRGAALSLSVVTIILASGTSLAQSAAERRDALAEVADLINDPDPLMRLANMEYIVEEGDPLKIQLAVKGALASDDQDLRGLAMKAYVAANRTIVFEMRPAAEDQEKLAKLSSEKDRQDYYRNTYLAYLDSFGFTHRFEFAEYEISSSGGTVHYGRNSSPFRIVGDRIEFETRDNWSGGITCHFAVRASTDLVLIGKVRCQRSGFPEFTIESRMY